LLRATAEALRQVRGNTMEGYQSDFVLAVLRGPKDARTLARHHDLSTQSWAFPRRRNGRAAVTALLDRAGSAP